MNEREIFFEALEMPTPDARAAYLQGACGRDVTLRRKVDELLKEHYSNDSLLAGPAMEADRSAEAKSPSPEAPAQMLGRYKLLEKIGEGGFGEVWMAEQREPVKRRVALKIIKLGMDSRQIVARFEAERQALAMMDHPNIAKIFDAGTTGAPDSQLSTSNSQLSQGRPYFVMELVRGIKITEYCDQNQLPTKERLDLFIKVCQAIQHAHQKGIIHRDIKPSNILVTLHDGSPVPKVIDFGIAKATQGELTDKTVFTQFQQFIGTPAYISPEQAEMSGLDIDTRADIYSLGVLLYELLVGQTPFDAKEMMQGGIDALRQIIREKEPLRPSTRLNTLQGDARTTAGKRRQTDVGKLVHQLQGDLDWIVMKCLEKDRTRRYDTANGLAMDIQRHLANEPVVARPASTAYRLQKAWRRNKLIYTAGLAVALALVAAVSLAFIAYAGRLSRLEQALTARQAQEERDRVLDTQRRQQRAREVDIPQIRQLLVLGYPVRAFQHAQETRAILPDDPTLAEVWNRLVTKTTITSEPSGARVQIRDWNATNDTEQWVVLGQTPLRDVYVPQDPRAAPQEDPALRWRLEKDNHIARELNASPEQIAQMGPIHLPVAAGSPEGMIFMPSKGADPGLGDFWIDRFEVTNRRFQAFVDAGGYERRDYWRHEFVQAGKKIGWEEAMATFRDTTGKPGPATWVNGKCPVGQEDYPVSGVSWFEAAAYAEFAGRSLPTTHHWKWAANPGGARYIVPLSNFSNRGLAPVGRHRGIGRFDVYDIAGNVKEWCWNESEDQGRCLRGGAWDDPPYMFGNSEARSPFERSPQFGFRCVKYLQQPSAEHLAARRTTGRDFASETRASRQQIDAYLIHYTYFRDKRLNARLISEEQAEGYLHQTVRIDSAYGEPFDLHLFLPRGGRAPYAPVVIMPDSDAFGPQPVAWPPAIYTGRFVKGLLQEGHAICWPVYEGTFERRKAANASSLSESERRDRDVRIAKDLSRAVDFLQTRDDMITNKLAYVGVSWGAIRAPTMLVVEPRFTAAVLIAGGYGGQPLLAETEPFQFAPYVKVPVLMINGRYDQNVPVESFQMPLLRDLGSADKQIKHFESGHAPPLEETIHLVNEWLREKLRESKEKTENKRP